MVTFEKLLYDAIAQAVEKYRSASPEGLLSDLYIQWNGEDGSLKFFDDEENFLIQVFTDTLDISLDESVIAKTLDELLRTPKIVELLNVEFTLRPFSIIVVDENFVTQSEHFLLESDSMILDQKFMDRLDKELDDFMHKLFE
ncbi:MAG: hypothetical protein ACRDD8_09360 [Bacteroidales bacterium]